MNGIEIRQITDKRGMDAFVGFYYDLYRGCEHAVPYLRADELATLDPRRNASFECCEAAYFMAYRGGKPVGRVAAIINHRANERWNCSTVRFGWFDFIDDSEVSAALLHAVEQWGRSKGMDKIVGPMGFTDMDREGMLVEGFDRLSTHYVNYNYPYYPQHIESMSGWVKDNDYVEYRVAIPDVVPDKFRKVAEMVGRRYNLQVRKFTRRELVSGGYGERIFELVNATYNDLYGYSHLSMRQIDSLIDGYIKKADLDLITGVVDMNDGGRLVGFGVTFPSISRAMQHTRDGRLLPLGWWHVLRALRWHHTDTVDLLLIGVLPEYRPKGANALIFNDLIPRFRHHGFKWAEAMPQMESNEHVRSQWQYLEAEQHRRHRCYGKTIE
ncbi:N-acetyltransferase [Prevotella sp. PCHR]|uniref:N-acetyltransferase n=1 Tax=Xylanibacter caecicola TaxID=2736294 RepID=A0ABX2AZW2_9BACT|nr:N-acetyltransferase [Xylanibacter caecicola]NPE24568.1 N-acetyltransferase [Xylanibacter caecicola]